MVAYLRDARPLSRQDSMQVGIYGGDRISVRICRLSFSTRQIQWFIIDTQRTGTLWAELASRVRAWASDGLQSQLTRVA